MARKRRKGEGSIIKRNGRYYLRGVNPATGKYTMRGLGTSSMEEARDAAKPILAEWSRLARLEEREEAILQLARTRKMIAEETHTLDDIWRLYLEAPTRPQKTSRPVPGKRRRHSMTSSFAVCPLPRSTV